MILCELASDSSTEGLHLWVVHKLHELYAAVVVF